MDWNGNGRIDPTDIGITIAAGKKDEPAPAKEPPRRPSGSETSGTASPGCLGAALMVLIAAGAILM